MQKMKSSLKLEGRWLMISARFISKIGESNWFIFYYNLGYCYSCSWKWMWFLVTWKLVPLVWAFMCSQIERKYMKFSYCYLVEFIGETFIVFKSRIGLMVRALGSLYEAVGSNLSAKKIEYRYQILVINNWVLGAFFFPFDFVFLWLFPIAYWLVSKVRVLLDSPIRRSISPLSFFFFFSYLFSVVSHFQ